MPYREKKKYHNSQNVSVTPFVWADLDTCPPDHLKLAPSFLWETSPCRHQALWRVDDLQPAEANLASQAIAAAHKADGCDTHGGLAKMLRLPGTANFKYPNHPQVRLHAPSGAIYSPDGFRCVYPWASAFGRGDTAPLTIRAPDTSELDGEVLLSEYNASPRMLEFFYVAPDHDWSGRLFVLYKWCWEKGMTLEEIFAATKDAACNKFARDNRPDEDLWKDINEVVRKYSHDWNRRNRNL